MKKILAVTLSILSISAFAAVHKNISYYDRDFPKSGNTEYIDSRCKLDINTPDDRKQQYPVLVWFHGGGLTQGNKHVPPQMDMKRTVIVSVNYRLSSKQAQCPDYIYDAAAAVAWTFKHIQEYGGNPEKIYVAGHSAGGYLSAMIALDPKYLKTFGATPDKIAAVFPISGQMTTHFQVLNERRQKDPNTPKIWLDEYAPIYLARKNTPVMYLMLGDTDCDWPARLEENRLMEARLRRNFGAKNSFILSYPKCNHGSVLIPSMLFINEYIKKH